MITPARFRPVRAEVQHADDWLMTYADMITLLLCFFAIFLTVSIPQHAETRQEPPAPQVIATTALPGIFDKSPQFHGVSVAEAQLSDIEARLNDIETAAGETEQAEISAPEPVPPQKDGDRITTINMDSATFFATGSAVIGAEGQAVLADVALRLGGDAYAGYVITVEGHTDDTPIATLAFPSNWELSTARASAVVHFFLDQGLPAARLRAAGYADTFPLAPNRDASGNAIPENQSHNRRVVIKLERVEKAQEASPLHG